MRVAGIIMECNPLHDGHRYLLKTVREEYEMDRIIVCMSGDFVQRGEPAVQSKETRAAQLLQSGADLVLELPLPYATGAAEVFARGAVTLLEGLGVVTDLFFGSESGEVEALSRCAAASLDESPLLQETLRRALESGLPYPKAYAEALSAAGAPLPEGAGANDTLGTMYLRTLFSSCRMPHSSQHPQEKFPYGQSHGSVYRGTDHQGPAEMPKGSRRSAYQGTDHQGPADIPEGSRGSEYQGTDAFPAAGAVRERASLLSPSILPHAVKRIRTDSASAIRERMRDSGCTGIWPSDLSLPLGAELIRLTEDNLCTHLYQDVSPDLAARICKCLPAYTDFEQFRVLVKTKNVTMARVSRSLLHILLDVRSSDLQAYGQAGSIGYARVLGMKRTSRDLLGSISRNGTFPLITRLSDIKKGSTVIPSPFDQMLRSDLRASALYDLLQRNRRIPDAPSVPEASKQPVMM